MKKSFLTSLLILSLIIFPMAASADLGDVLAKSKDINITMFGSMKVLPHFVENADFNNDTNTSLDWGLDEWGVFEDHNVRAEFRVGWAAKADDWDFLVILESDFVMNKANGDRGSDPTHNTQFPFGNTGFTGEDFGVEKINFGYNFGPFKINVGWNTKFLDIRTGGILYGDDHPYIAFTGKNWEFIYLMIQDDTRNFGAGFDGDVSDWRAYTFRYGFKVGNMTIAPMVAWSDNEAVNADAYYFGFEGYGKLGMLTPRFEFVYATGEKNNTAMGDMDISAYGAFGSLEAAVSKAFNPYIGFYYLSGDDDATDDDIEAFNGITNISRYTPTFGMENAIVYRYFSSLGTHLYSNNFNRIGTGGSGYGGISNSSTGDAPGMLMFGLGAKGVLSDRLSYKTQLMYFSYAEEDNVATVDGTTSDDEVGIEFDLQLTYKFNKHFSVGNVLAVFMPGDAIEDRLGSDHDDEMIVDTIEIIWKF
jgi:hypothetical protein